MCNENTQQSISCFYKIYKTYKTISCRYFNIEIDFVHVCFSCVHVVHLQVRDWNVCRMSSTFVTLAEVLEARGGPLLEEEVWSLLLATAESLVDASYKGKSFQISSSYCTHTYITRCLNAMSIP